MLHLHILYTKYTNSYWTSERSFFTGSVVSFLSTNSSLTVAYYLFIISFLYSLYTSLVRPLFKDDFSYLDSSCHSSINNFFFFLWFCCSKNGGSVIHKENRCNCFSCIKIATDEWRKDRGPHVGIEWLARVKWIRLNAVVGREKRRQVSERTWAWNIL